MHVLIVGWFSFEYMGNTAGDMIACDEVGNWLNTAGISYEVAVASPFPYAGKVNLQDADPARFTDVIFVCGPFGNGWPITGLLDRFAHCRLTGINLTVLESLDSWNPFTLLYERDSSRATHPDITFIAPPPKVPVAGIILAHKQKEYGSRSLHDKANEAIQQLVNSREMSVVKIDTALEKNEGGLRTPGEIEALIAKMDVVITTRLHGTVLSLKNGVPVVAVDPIAGGAKVTSQVDTFGWPVLLSVDTLTEATLLEAYDYCLTEEARAKVAECKKRAVAIISQTRENFLQEFPALANVQLSLV